MKLREYIEEHYSSKSVSGYENQIRQFRDQMGERSRKASYGDIVEYIGILRTRINHKTGECLHPKSIRNHLFAIKIYFRYLVSVGYRQDHPCENLQLKDQINRAIIVDELYTKEALEELYKTYESKKNKAKIIKQRDKIILSLLIFQALTVSEITTLKTRDIDMEELEISIKENRAKRRRGNKGRILSMNIQQVLIFKDYLSQIEEGYFIQAADKNQLYISYISRMLKHHKKQYTPMKIRQSVIAHLLKENNDLRIVQEFAGHRRTGSTEAYKRTGLEELKSSIEKWHPRQ